MHNVLVVSTDKSLRVLVEILLKSAEKYWVGYSSKLPTGEQIQEAEIAIIDLDSAPHTGLAMARTFRDLKPEIAILFLATDESEGRSAVSRLGKSTWLDNPLQTRALALQQKVAEAINIMQEKSE